RRSYDGTCTPLAAIASSVRSFSLIGTTCASGSGGGCGDGTALTAAVDRFARLGVEEVKSARVDDEFETAAFACARVRPDAGDEVRSFLERLDVLVLVGDGRYLLGGDGEVDEHLGSESLAEGADDGEAAVRRGAGHGGGVFDVLGADAEDERAAFVF